MECKKASLPIRLNRQKYNFVNKRNFAKESADCYSKSGSKDGHQFLSPVESQWAHIGKYPVEIRSDYRMCKFVSHCMCLPIAKKQVYVIM